MTGYGDEPRFSPAHLAFFIALLGGGAVVLVLLGLDAWNDPNSGRPAAWVAWLVIAAAIGAAVVVPYGKRMKGGGLLFALVGTSAAAAVSQIRDRSTFALALFYLGAAAATATTVVRVAISELRASARSAPLDED